MQFEYLLNFIKNFFIPAFYIEIFLTVLNFFVVKPLDIFAENKYVRRIFAYLGNTFVGKLYFKLFKMDSENALASLDAQAKKFINHASVNDGQRLLLEDRRYDYAQYLVPKDKFPTLYTDVPEDLKRDIISDGRTLDGYAPAVSMAGKTVTEDLVIGSWRNAIYGQMKITLGVLVVGFFLSLSATGVVMKDIQLWVKTTDR